MKAIATKQPTNESVKQNKSGEKGRSRSVSPLSTGMPLLQRKCACGGGCPRCTSKNRQLLQINIGPQNQLASAIPGYWKVSQPDNILENQADQLAKQILNVNGNNTTSLSSFQDGYRFNSQKGGASSTQSSSVLGDSGKPLEPEQKAFFESRLKADLSDVRIHTGSQPSHMAKHFNAEAFAVGQDIVFGENYYQPNTSQGKSLLAHELAHVVQQRASVSNEPMILRRLLRNAPVNRLCGSTGPAVLRSPPSGFLKLEGSESKITVTSNIRWDRARGCPDGGEFFIKLNQQDHYFWGMITTESDQGEKTFSIGIKDTESWSGLDGDADYSLDIISNNTNPHCCLTGTIEISAS
jgi:hypothetical protein